MLDAKEEFEKAVLLKDSGKLIESKVALESIRSLDNLSNRQSYLVLAVLGDVNWKLSCLDEAIKNFQSAVAIRPDCDAVSLGLFNTLWESGKEVEALKELKRFHTATPLKEYGDILSELKGDPKCRPLLEIEGLI